MQWKDEYAIGIDVIDEQHKKLTGFTNKNILIILTILTIELIDIMYLNFSKPTYNQLILKIHEIILKLSTNKNGLYDS